MSTLVREAFVEDEVEEEIVKLVRRDVVGLRVIAGDGDVGKNDTNINSLLRRTSLGAIQEIDYLINQLQISRERLLIESERVEREIFEYAALNQSVLQATELIAERLSQLHTIPNAPSIADEDYNAAEYFGSRAMRSVFCRGEG